MEAEWLGARLEQAAPALSFRMRAPTNPPAEQTLGPLAQPLLQEIGQALSRREWAPELPLQRTCLLWQVPLGLSHSALALGFNAFGRLVREHLSELPGMDEEIDAYLLATLRHSARSLLVLRHLLSSGLPTRHHERAFGGTLLLVQPLPPPSAVFDIDVMALSRKP